MLKKELVDGRQVRGAGKLIISEFQADGVLAFPWLFVVHKATEGTTYADPQFARRFPTIRTIRGAYHYARPLDGDGGTQAGHFADTCLAAGFKPGVDIWQLDCEGMGNPKSMISRRSMLMFPPHRYRKSMNSSSITKAFEPPVASR